jgi:hypothetical protein
MKQNKNIEKRFYYYGFIITVLLFFFLILEINSLILSTTKGYNKSVDECYL